MTFDEWLESQERSEIGRQYMRCRDRVARHYYARFKDRMFGDVTILSHAQAAEVEAAVDGQLIKSHNVILWMVWKLTPAEILAEAGMPVKQKDFCEMLEVSESLPRQWRKTYEWLDGWLFTADRTGKEILHGVSDDILVEIGENALNQTRGDQLGWAKLAIDIVGLKAPTVTKNFEVDVSELTDDQIDAIASGEDPKKVLQ